MGLELVAEMDMDDREAVFEESNINEGLVASFIENDEETDNFIFEIVLGLYGSKSLTLKHCDEIVEYFKMISDKTAKLCAKRISECMNIEEAQKLLNEHPIIDFAEYSSEYKLKEKLIEMNLFREPTKFTIANEVVERLPGELDDVPHLGVCMDIEFQITRFLEIDGVLDLILNHQDYLRNVPEGMYKNFINGKSWRKISSNYEGKTLIPLFLYNDDFTVC